MCEVKVDNVTNCRNRMVEVLSIGEQDIDDLIGEIGDWGLYPYTETEVRIVLACLELAKTLYKVNEIEIR